MADRVLVITWAQPVRGLEERSLEVFNEAMGLYGRMQQEGRIESFNVVLLAPNGELNGYIELRGSAEQLAAAREAEDFMRVTINAELVVDRLRMLDGYTDTAIAAQMALYQDAISKVPQRA